MTGIKVLLVTGFLSGLIWGVRNRSRAGMRAGARVLALVIVLLAITAVLFPSTTVFVAHLVGVDRGTDLVVYLLALVFFVTTVHNHLRFRDVEHRLTRVVRANALRDALPPSVGSDRDGEPHDHT